MTLNGNTQATLGSIARTIVSGRDRDMLSEGEQDDVYFALIHDRDAAVACLAECVAHHSKGRSTVRQADIALFAGQHLGMNLFLALCPSDTPEGVVTELAEEMVLVRLGPYDDGLDIDAERASRK